MTHPVAHAILKAAPQYSVSPAVTVTYLPLNGNGPFTVYVKASNDGSLEFTSSGVTGTNGAEWFPVKPVPPSTQITFEFVLPPGGPTITSLTSNSTGLVFRPPVGSQQVGTVVGIAGGYPFTVNTSVGASNAQIVVTPIGGSGGDDD